ncbi:hypothetical protein [Thiohalophilus sp.]|uniref:DUF7931 domain-containing protein n=1 Tax=Thiohalophilus sp. TaxID=3028392 RepID=UPI002ACD7465|nr:hypothetical protein [Thiohalophilus sp.]MDZ7662909.1 hypothetical protein [Thiohalophilus sp.]
MAHIDDTPALTRADIGEQTGELIVNDSQDNYQTLLNMLDKGRRSLAVYSRYLDGKLYDQQEFSIALRRLATRHPQSQVRILIRDIEPLVRHGHRLIELARHLSSSMEIRLIHKDYTDNNETFFIVDERAVLHRKQSDRYEGIANYNDPRLAHYLLQHFNEVWEHSQVPTDARRLYL